MERIYSIPPYDLIIREHEEASVKSSGLWQAPAQILLPTARFTSIIALSLAENRSITIQDAIPMSITSLPTQISFLRKHCGWQIHNYIHQEEVPYWGTTRLKTNTSEYFLSQEFLDKLWAENPHIDEQLRHNYSRKLGDRLIGIRLSAKKRQKLEEAVLNQQVFADDEKEHYEETR